jgi:OOP family OmpA-OmpF porin
MLTPVTQQGGESMMRWNAMGTKSLVAVSTALVFGLTGCATMRQHPTACKVGAGLLGGALGATGGGLGVSEIEPTPDDGERAAGAGAGFVVGALAGALIGHYACQPEPPPPPPPPPPAPAPAPAPKKIESLDGPNFDFDKDTLRPQGKVKLDNVARVLQENPEMRVVIEGHTDAIGTEAYNEDLSHRRTETVRSYLIEKGIGAGRLTARWFGESKPVASNATEEGRAQNRRVDIIAE